MIVYKSKYNARSKPRYFEKTAVSNEESVMFEVFVLPKNTSLYSILSDKSTFSYISMTVVECIIYICVTDPITIDLIDEIEKFIKDTVTNVVLTKDPLKIKPVSVVNSTSKALEIFKNICLFYSSFENDIYKYINYRNETNYAIDEHDELVCYRTMIDRNAFNPVFGKVMNSSRKVLIFNFYPLKCSNMVYLLPEDFYIIPESNNRVALITFEETFTFWLVSSKHPFFNLNKEPQKIVSSKFCLKSLSNVTLNKLYEVFQLYNFNDIKTSTSCIYSEDDDCNLMLFVGIYDLANSFKYSKCFEFLIGY